jgi:hypothetical protein
VQKETAVVFIHMSGYLFNRIKKFSTILVFLKKRNVLLKKALQKISLLMQVFVNKQYNIVRINAVDYVKKRSAEF